MKLAARCCCQSIDDKYRRYDVKPHSWFYHPCYNLFFSLIINLEKVHSAAQLSFLAQRLHQTRLHCHADALEISTKATQEFKCSTRCMCTVSRMKGRGCQGKTDAVISQLVLWHRAITLFFSRFEMPDLTGPSGSFQPSQMLNIGTANVSSPFTSKV